MQDLSGSPLGKKVAYVDQYDPNVLFPINRDEHRQLIGVDVQVLPFQGLDIYNCFDFTWLNAKNIPEYGMLTIYVPCDSANFVEAKSLKLYLFSFANSQFQSINEIIATIEQDLSAIVGAKVKIALANILLDFMHIDARFPGISLDDQNIRCDVQEAQVDLLLCDPKQIVSEELSSELLKFNCPITSKPDWGSVRIEYTGSKIDRAGLLKYIVSYRNHKALQEQCIERIYFDILKTCSPTKLVVEGRFTRRSGLDINPIRGNVEFDQRNRRLFRQ